MAALGMDHDEALGVALAERGDLLDAESLVDRAVTLPEQEGGVLGLDLFEATEAACRVPGGHRLQRVPELDTGVAPEVLVGEEQHLVRSGVSILVGRQCPGEHRSGVR